MTVAFKYNTATVIFDSGSETRHEQETRASPVGLLYRFLRPFGCRNTLFACHTNSVFCERYTRAFYRPGYRNTADCQSGDGDTHHYCACRYRDTHGDPSCYKMVGGVLH